MRPPTGSSSQASGSALSSASSSPLTAIRIAWKARLAGCPRPKRSDGRHRGLDRRDQLAGRLDRAAADDLARHRAGAALLAELAQHARDPLLGPLVDDLGGRQLLLGVHAHVERRVVGVGEAALPVVHLHRGHAEVEDDAVGPHALAAQPLQRGREVRAQEAGPRRRLGGELAPALLAGGVAVDRDQLALGAQALGDQPRVAARAEGAVEEGLAGLRVEDLDQLGGQYGLVVGGHIAQCSPLRLLYPPRSCRRRAYLSPRFPSPGSSSRRSPRRPRHGLLGVGLDSGQRSAFQISKQSRIPSEHAAAGRGRRARPAAWGRGHAPGRVQVLVEGVAEEVAAHLAPVGRERVGSAQDLGAEALVALGRKHPDAGVEPRQRE